MRNDLLFIGDIVKEKSRILEIGCGKGELLEHLSNNKQVDARGIELSQSGVSYCVQRGLSVIHGNAEKDLQHYSDKCFDYAICSQVLQATHNPKEVTSEMLRIAKQVIISIPNFGSWRNRLHLLLKGRMPVTKTLSYQWYETPNIHFCTLKDFDLLVKELDAKIKEKIVLNDAGERIPKLGSNLIASKAIYVLG